MKSYIPMRKNNKAANNYVSDKEMDDILSDIKLIKGIRNSLKDVKKGKYKIIKRVKNKSN
jgi:hypothetical protein